MVGRHDDHRNAGDVRHVELFGAELEAVFHAGIMRSSKISAGAAMRLSCFRSVLSVDGRDDLEAFELETSTSASQCPGRLRPAEFSWTFLCRSTASVVFIEAVSPLDQGCEITGQPWMHEAVAHGGPHGNVTAVDWRDKTVAPPPSRCRRR